MKAKDLREKSVEDLRELQASLRTDTFQNRLKNFTNRLDDTSAIRKTKRDLARVHTLLGERARTAAPAAAATAEAPAAATEVAATPKKKSSKKSEAKQS
jgi:large subunit ribosomal protein L29